MNCKISKAKSNYRKIGDFIQQVNIKNDDGSIKLLLGVNLDKKFIPSVANTIGTDMTKYKVIKKGQFGCKLMSVGRDKKLPISRLINNEKAIISSAYYVFEVIDENILSPEYLMMWFQRPESDRYLWFQSGGDIRGRITWDDLCQLPIKIPSIEKQHEIVKEYNTVANRITLNETINKKLEDTAQALYKNWFVDFEFPNKQGKPYKSNGGKMVYNEELDLEIPLGWESGSFKNLANINDGDRGKNYPSKEELLPNGYCLFLSALNVSYKGFKFNENVFLTEQKSKQLKSGKLKLYDIVMTSRGSTIGKLGYFNDITPYKNIRVNSGMLIFNTANENTSLYLFCLLKSINFQKLIKGYFSGSAQPQIPIRDLITIPVLIPENKIIETYSIVIKPIQKIIDLNKLLNDKLSKLKNLLLSKMSKVAIEKEMVC